MTKPLDPLRKAAILLASLDADTADGLIEQMPPKQARRARELMLQLDDINPAEQQEVIDEFLKTGPHEESGDDGGVEDGGVEIEASLAEQLAIAAPVYHQQSAEPTVERRAEVPTRPVEPFGFLQDADSESLVSHLEDEHPQTVAVIVSHLPPQRAGEVLAGLPDTMQAEVIRRLIDLGQTDPDLVREVERGLLAGLAGDVGRCRVGRRGAAAVQSILHSADDETRQSILENLTAHAPSLANQFVPPSAAAPEAAAELTFDDISRLSDLAVAKIFTDVGPDVLTLALAGAHPSFVQRVLSQLPRRDAKRLRRTLEELGPTRLTDVEQAQRELVQVARRLDAQGRIELPGRKSISLTI